jgi:GTP-binding protein
MKPVVAIVGRSNVGKSTLFNKLVGRRVSIVKDTPGVTRDRIYEECEWSGKTFTLIDTGGLDPSTDDEFGKKIIEQANLAIDEADVIIFLTDIKTGPVSSDLEIAHILKRSRIPVVLAVNKCDSIGDTPSELYDFYNLGLGEPYPVSSLHGHGTGDLLDKVISYFKTGESEDDSEYIRVAVIGKPNVGKSTLINKIVGENRCIVTNIPGTTRDSIDIRVENKYGKYIFSDTAGLRKKSKVDDSIEYYSDLRTELSVNKADVCIIMISAEDGFTEQDSKVASVAMEGGKACLIAVNKWDLITKNENTMSDFESRLKDDFSFISYAPFVFISAIKGQRLDQMFETINEVYKSSSTRITTGRLNDVLSKATAKVQPPTDKGKRLRIYYMSQVSTKPPTFIIFVNTKDLFHFSYQRYIENQLRDTFGLVGTPIILIIREHGENETYDLHK